MSGRLPSLARPLYVRWELCARRVSPGICVHVSVVCASLLCCCGRLRSADYSGCCYAVKERQAHVDMAKVDCECACSWCPDLKHALEIGHPRARAMSVVSAQSKGVCACRVSDWACASLCSTMNPKSRNSPAIRRLFCVLARDGP